MPRRIRYWLIRYLAGKDTVVVNATLQGTGPYHYDIALDAFKTGIIVGSDIRTHDSIVSNNP